MSKSISLDSVLGAVWVNDLETPGVVLVDLGAPRGVVDVMIVDAHRALDLTDADCTALAQHLVDVHNGGLSRVLADVVAKRRMQDEQHGGQVHDDMHKAGELAIAGAVYALDAVLHRYGAVLDGDTVQDARNMLRPVSPCGHSPAMARAHLLNAIGCIVAEVERLDREIARLARAGVPDVATPADGTGVQAA